VRFEFATAGRILFGPGRAADLPAIVAGLGRRPVFVTGRHPDRWTAIINAASEDEGAAAVWATRGEPTIAHVREGVAVLRAHHADVVVAIGGGSVIDAGKAIAALATNEGDAIDYLEVVGQGRPLTRASLPCVAVPTTSGTGSEVTRNAVLGVPEHGVKVSLRGASMLPRVALVDPNLSLGVPPPVTASTGLDALTQLIEAYVSVRANPITDAMCIEGMRHAAGALHAVWMAGGDRRGREAMALASLLSGLALANAGLGAVHGFAAPIGGRFAAPHGAICAALLPHVCAMNLEALVGRAVDSQAHERYDGVARILTGRTDARGEDGIAWMRHTVAALEVPPLRAYGLRDTDIPDLVARASRASSMAGNPVPLTEGELATILERAL
jgi:alcohol dehydrogenase class IV